MKTAYHCSTATKPPKTSNQINREGFEVMLMKYFASWNIESAANGLSINNVSMIWPISDPSPTPC